MCVESDLGRYVYRFTLIWLLCSPAWAGQADLSWTAPTQNVDGSAYTNPGGYRVYRRCNAESLTQIADVPHAQLAYTDTVPDDGRTCWWSLTAYNDLAEESARTNEVSKTFAAAPVELPGSVSATFAWDIEAEVAITVTDSVARWSASISNGGTTSSASFTPANSSLLVVCVNIDESPGPNSVTLSGGGWTYTQRVARGQSDATEGYAAIYTAPVTTGASMTITATLNASDGAPRRVSAKVYIVEGQHASPIGANNEADWTTNNQTTSLTATGAGRLFGCGTDWSALGAPTSTDTEDAAHYAGAISVMSAYKAADHSSGTQGINFDAATGTPSGNVVILEILAAAGAAAASLPPVNRSARMAAMISH